MVACTDPSAIFHSPVQARLLVSRTFDRRLASLPDTGGGGKIPLIISSPFHHKDKTFITTPKAMIH